MKFKFAKTLLVALTVLLLGACGGGSSDPGGGTVKDTAKPIVSAINFNAVVQKETPVTITVTATDNVGVSGVDLYVDDLLKAPMTSMGGNSYTYNLPTPTVGNFSLQARAKDAAGNVGQSESKNLTVQSGGVVDTQPPVLGVLSANKTTVDKGASVILTITATDNIGVTSVDLRVNGTKVGSFASSGGNNYTYTYNATTVGAFSLQVFANDAVNLTAISNTITLTVNEGTVEDKTPPTVGFLTLSPSTVTQGTPVTVTIDVSDDVGMGTVELRVDGVSKGNMTLTSGNTYSYTLATPSEGTFQLQVFANDAAENFAMSNGATLTVTKNGGGGDTTPPVVTAFNLNPATVTTGTPVTVTVNVTDNAGVASVELYVDGAPEGNMTLTSGSTYSYMLATPNEGTFQLQVYAKDAAGNVATSAGKSLTVNKGGEGPDTEKPTVGALTVNNNSPKVGDTVVVTVVAMDNVAVTAVDFYVDGAKKGAFTKGAGNNWTFSWNTTGLAVKAYALKATATDAAGNSAESAVRNQALSTASSWVSPAAKPYHAVADFGEAAYKSGIKMNLHIPANMPENAPVVIAFHGCSQVASAFKADTGWTDLADKYKFYVIFPEMNKSQNDSNQAGNSYGCFNWAGYYGRNFGRGVGDSASLLRMVKYVQEKYSAGKAYATGLSAGGGMAAVLGAFYPDEFDAIAPMSGPVFGCAVFDSTGKKLPTTAKAVEQAAYDCMGITSSFTPRSGSIANMNPNKNRTGDMWAKHVRDSGPAGYTGPYPRVFSWIGTKDQLVDPVHNNLHVQQWTRLHGIDETADNADKKFKTGSGVRDHVYNEYQDAGGKPLVKTLLITNMGHGIAVDPGTGEDQGGTGAAADCYGLFCSWKTAVGIHSSYYSAKFFGILGGGGDIPDGTATVTITAPAAGSSVAENAVVKITATATDDTLEKVGINNVEFYVNGMLLCTDVTAPYSCDWNTTGIANGAKVNIEVVAYNNIVFTSGKKAIDVYVGKSAFTCVDYPGSMYTHRTSTPARARVEGTCTLQTAECTYKLTGSNNDVKISGNDAFYGKTPLKETSAGYFEEGTCN